VLERSERNCYISTNEPLKEVTHGFAAGKERSLIEKKRGGMQWASDGRHAGREIFALGKNLLSPTRSEAERERHLYYKDRSGLPGKPVETGTEKEGEERTRQNGKRVLENGKKGNSVFAEACHFRGQKREVIGQPKKEPRSERGEKVVGGHLQWRANKTPYLRKRMRWEEGLLSRGREVPNLTEKKKKSLGLLQRSGRG